MNNGYSPQGWYADPTSPGGARYWNGVSWTQAVSRGGVTFNAPIDPAQATLAPVPGTQVAAPPPIAGRPTSVEYALPSDQSSSNSTLGVVLGVLVAFFVVLMIFAIVSNDDSSDQSPPSTDAPPATEAPAEGG